MFPKEKVSYDCNRIFINMILGYFYEVVLATCLKTCKQHIQKQNKYIDIYFDVLRCIVVCCFVVLEAKNSLHICQRLFKPWIKRNTVCDCYKMRSLDRSIDINFTKREKFKRRKTARKPQSQTCSVSNLFAD